MAHSIASRWRTLAAALLGLALTACGSADGVGSGGTGSFALGTITGFGSIVVNGVHYDESGALITDAAGQAGTISALKLGMVVEVDASAIQADAATGRRHATAYSIRYGSEIEGPVESIDAAAGEFLVLGQIVQVDAATVFDDALRGGLAALRAGDIVEISGYARGDGRYRATRIDREDDTQDGYELHGPIASQDVATRTLRIGGALIDTSAIGTVPALAIGEFVRVELATGIAPDGRWIATRMTVGALGTAPHDLDEGEIEGYVTTFSGPTRFSVNGVPVDASGVATLPAGLGLGVRVEVEGTLVSGQLIAREVTLEDDGVGEELEFDGIVSGHDAAARTFVLHGVTIAYGGAVQFENGDAAMLRDGIRVEVDGHLAADGVIVQAERIEFDD